MSKRREEDEDDREVQGATGGEGKSRLAQYTYNSKTMPALLFEQIPQIFS